MISWTFCFLSLPKKMDMNQDGVVTLDEFVECCRNDATISQNLAAFDSSFWHDAQVSDDTPKQMINGGPPPPPTTSASSSQTGKKTSKTSSAPSKNYHQQYQPYYQHPTNYQYPTSSVHQYPQNVQFNQAIYQCYPQQVSSLSTLHCFILINKMTIKIYDFHNKKTNLHIVFAIFVVNASISRAIFFFLWITNKKFGKTAQFHAQAI